jgi:hypothetical protein
MRQKSALGVSRVVALSIEFVRASFSICVSNRALAKAECHRYHPSDGIDWTSQLAGPKLSEAHPLRASAVVLFCRKRLEARRGLSPQLTINARQLNCYSVGVGLRQGDTSKIDAL